MRKLFLILLLGCGAAVAQSLPVVTVSVDPSGACTNERLLYNIANGKLWGCDTGTWTSIGSGTGGSCAALGGDVTGTCSANTAVKINGVALSGLATGILKNTTGTGAPSTAVAGDFPTLNQNTTGTAAGLTAAYVDWNAVSGGASILNKPTVPTVTGGTCTNQAVTAISSSAVPTCTTITSAYTDASIVPATRTVAGHALSSDVTISASDITTGALPAAQLPNPSASTLGGVQSIATATHNFMTGISTSGVPSKSQPACADLSDAGTGCSGSASAHPIGAAFDGGGSALSTGKKIYYTVPFACTISGWNMTVDTGTATVDVWKIATGTAIPTISNTITASALPAVATGTALHSTTLTGWTTSVTANDIFAFNINAVSGATLISLVLQCQ